MNGTKLMDSTRLEEGLKRSAKPSENRLSTIMDEQTEKSFKAILKHVPEVPPRVAAMYARVKKMQDRIAGPTTRFKPETLAIIVVLAVLEEEMKGDEEPPRMGRDGAGADSKSAEKT